MSKHRFDEEMPEYGSMSFEYHSKEDSKSAAKKPLYNLVNSSGSFELPYQDSLSDEMVIHEYVSPNASMTVSTRKAFRNTNTTDFKADK